jgi:hypothetical protein
MMLPITRIILLVMDECMNVDWWNYTERRRPLILGEKPVPVPLSHHKVHMNRFQTCGPVVTGW